MTVKDKIYEYFINELKVSNRVADILFNKINIYDDIYSCFVIWLDNRDYSQFDYLEIEGYTAKNIKQKFPFFKGIGVFNILVDLRDNKEKTLELIAKGFPRK